MNTMTEDTVTTFVEPLTGAETEQVQQWLADDLAKGRISREQYDRAMAPPIATTPSAITSTAPLVPTVTQGPVTALSIAEGVKAGRLTTSQAGALVRAGGLDMNQVTSALFVLNAPVESKAEETGSPEMVQLNQDFPAGTPDSYTIRYSDAGQEPVVMTAALKEFDESARVWLSSAELPTSLGNAVVNEIDRVVRSTHHMSASQLEDYGYQQFEQLRQVYGDKLEDKLNQAGRMINELEHKKPGLKQLLQAKGIGDNAMVASLIIQQSERYFERRK